MTDKQLEFIVNLIAEKIASCQDMAEVLKAIEWIKAACGGA